MAETYTIEGKCYQKGWIFGFFGKKHNKCFSMAACLPEGVNLHGKEIKMTIEVKERGA